MKKVLFFSSLLLCLWPATLMAGKADVIRVEVDRSGSLYSFSVSVTHRDEGWDHYADKWDVVGPDGKVLATRTLYHPHVNEQPFTRNLSGVAISSDVESVTVRAHDLVHGYGGKEMNVALPR